MTLSKRSYRIFCRKVMHVTVHDILPCFLLLRHNGGSTLSQRKVNLLNYPYGIVMPARAEEMMKQTTVQ